MGFICGKNSYLSNGWNKLDFIIVVLGVWSLLGGANIGVIRTVRLLRPLRSINRVRGISDLVSSLIESIPSMLNVVFFLLFIILLFATFGLHLFAGMYEFRCRVLDPVTETWSLYPDYYKLCSKSQNNCPAGSQCLTAEEVYGI